MGWVVNYDKGVHLPQVGWSLDASEPRARCFVSHAHFDHLARHREVICTRGTSRLMRARLPGRRTEHLLGFGRPEQLTPDCSVTLHPAGHIAGSAQILLGHERLGSLLYTGDFKLRSSLAAEACATPRADVLIMETTYGLPRYVLPPAEEVWEAILSFCRSALASGDTPVLFGYSLGRSQELLAGVGAAGLPVMLHPEAARLTRLHEELGWRFPAYTEFDPPAARGHVVICPHQGRDSRTLRQIPSPRTAVVTGWAMDQGARFRHGCDAAFALSDHADFPDLLRFVERVRPRRVLTLHGFAAEFAATLRALGIDAWALNQDNQMDLGLR